MVEPKKHEIQPLLGVENGRTNGKEEPPPAPVHVKVEEEKVEPVANFFQYPVLSVMTMPELFPMSSYPQTSMHHQFSTMNLHYFRLMHKFSQCIRSGLVG